MSQSTAPTTAPTPVTFVRVLVSVQLLAATILTVLSTVLVTSAYRSDQAAARAGDPNDLAGLGEILGAMLIVACIASILLIGIPLLRLRRGHPGARIALIIGEAVVTLPFAGVLGLLLSNSGGLLADGFVLDPLPLVVIVLLCTRQARSWTQLPLDAAYAARAQAKA